MCNQLTSDKCVGINLWWNDSFSNKYNQEEIWNKTSALHSTWESTHYEFNEMNIRYETIKLLQKMLQARQRLLEWNLRYLASWHFKVLSFFLCYIRKSSKGITSYQVRATHLLYVSYFIYRIMLTESSQPSFWVCINVCILEMRILRLHKM